MLIQKLHFTFEEDLGTANAYFNVLVALNNLPVSSREIQLLAFTAVRGNISYKEHREEFCEKYTTSMATINNIISKLKKLNLLIKDGKKGVKLNPALKIDFKKDIVLQITLQNEEAK